MRKIILFSILLFPISSFADICPTQNIQITPTGSVFGNYSSVSNDANAGKILLQCSLPGYSISAIVTAMVGSGGNYAVRKMINNTHSLNYNLFIDPAYTRVWGDGTGASYPVCAVCSTGGCTATVNIYGVIPSGQALLPAGSYADAIAITATAGAC